MTERLRSKNVNIRMTDLEFALLEELADAIGMSMSDVVRQLIRREHSTRMPTTTTR